MCLTTLSSRLHVSQSQLKSIIELTEEKYVKLVSYHKIRLLSLNECVQRLVQLHPILCAYFQQEVHDMANHAVVRKKCEDLKERLQDPKILLYLFFFAHIAEPNKCPVSVQKCRNL